MALKLKVFAALLWLLSLSDCWAQAEHFDGMRIRANVGMIAVLEAPLFAVPDQNAKVIQRVRKGEEIYIHPAEFQLDRYQRHRPRNSQNLEKHREAYAQEFPDPLFQGDKGIYRPSADSNFYKTLASNGQDAYILKEHVFLLYNDLRELEQEIASPDPTDYRLEEPLPENFPFHPEPGRRGMAAFSLGTPRDAPYSYPQNIIDTGYDLYKEFSVVWASNIRETNQRFFLGGMFALASYDTRYLLPQMESREENLKISIGPYVSYDIWKTQKYTASIFGSIQFVFYDWAQIEQRSFRAQDSGSEKRSFTARHFAPRLGTEIIFPRAFFALDAVLGAAAQFEFARSYEASEKAENSSWWKGEKFERPAHLQVAYFMGLMTNF